MYKGCLFACFMLYLPYIKILIGLIDVKKTKKDITEELGTGAILPLVFRLTIPAVAAQLITFLYNKVIILIPLCFVLTHFLGFKGVYMSEGIADFAAGLITAAVIFTTFPRIFKRREEEVAAKLRKS